MSMIGYSDKLGVVNNFDDELRDLENNVENCESVEEYKETCKDLITLAENIIQELQNNYDKLEEIDSYIADIVNNDNIVEYDNMLWYMSRDNILTEDLKTWLEQFMKWYNKKVEGIDVWN